jgi:hypothetical protein
MLMAGQHTGTFHRPREVRQSLGAQVSIFSAHGARTATLSGRGGNTFDKVLLNPRLKPAARPVAAKTLYYSS